MGNKHASLDDILAEDMHHWYNKFMRESPSGLITLFELKSILGLQGMNEDASSYVDQVFFTFDMDGVRLHSLVDILTYACKIIMVICMRSSFIGLLHNCHLELDLKWIFQKHLCTRDQMGKVRSTQWW